MSLPDKLAYARLSTGTKMLLILTAAMLPLGFIALLTSLDMARTASVERKAAAQTSAALFAAQAEALLQGGLSGVKGLLFVRQSPEYLCGALRRQVRLQGIVRPPTALFDSTGRKLCQSYGEPIVRAARTDPDTEHVWLDPARRRFRFTAARADGSLSVETAMPISALRLKTRSEEGLPLRRLVLRQGEAEVVLVDRGTPSQQDVLRVSQPLADGRLAIIADYEVAKIQARTALLVAMPILMWAAAAFLGWLVVSRLLLLPLNQIKRAIDTWQGSQEPFSLPRINTPSHEIRELAESFSSTASRIYDHERELEEGLQRQTKLTREVHHRVKNNLQVVSSLINLHARGAQGDVAAAYGAIQRRVDALAVVHRNHYAELEENRGVSMRSLAGELASSLRASAPPTAAGMPIALNMIDVYVTQDVAVPVAFLITEVVELLMYRSPQGSVLISLEKVDDPSRANLRIEAIGMKEHALDDYADTARFDRVVTGIARQFRAPLVKDLQAGRFEIQIGILA
jgi:two-component sensor histidine kinase